MSVKATKYLLVETTMSGVVNGILNFVAAFAMFHGRSPIPVAGPGGLLRDTIGETFIVTSLSVLIPTLIARHRRRAGTLPASGDSQQNPVSIVYLRAIVAGLIFTCVCVPCSALVLPLIFRDSVSLGGVLRWKALYGAIVGSIATSLAIHQALNEPIKGAQLINSKKDAVI